MINDRRRSQDFLKRGSHCVKVRVLTRLSCRPPRSVFDLKKSLKKGPFNYGQDIVMAFSPPVVGCLVKKDLQKGGGHGHPRTPLATPLNDLGRIGSWCFKESDKSFSVVDSSDSLTHYMIQLDR